MRRLGKERTRIGDTVAYGEFLDPVTPSSEALPLSIGMSPYRSKRGQPPACRSPHGRPCVDRREPAPPKARAHQFTRIEDQHDPAFAPARARTHVGVHAA